MFAYLKYQFREFFYGKRFFNDEMSLEIDALLIKTETQQEQIDALTIKVEDLTAENKRLKSKTIELIKEDFFDED